MTKKIKRSKELEVVLSIKDDKFINPPKQAQRNGLLNKALAEFVEDLYAIDEVATSFVPGNEEVEMGLKDRSQSTLSDQEIMEDWQIPIMEEMADLVCETHGDVLEIGFGRGVSATMIQDRAVRSHTIIECNNSIITRYEDWKLKFEKEDIRLVEGLWQEMIQELGFFDGIFFHTYPLNEEEYMKYVHGKVTFAEHFFSTAAEHLKEGGVFTYFSNEIDSLSRSHQRALLKWFSSFGIKKVALDLPENVKDTYWANSMVVIKAVK